MSPGSCLAILMLGIACVLLGAMTFLFSFSRRRFLLFVATIAPKDEFRKAKYAICRSSKDPSFMRLLGILESLIGVLAISIFLRGGCCDVPEKPISKYILVIVDGKASRIDIYKIDRTREVSEVWRWSKKHIHERRKAKVGLFWHSELLNYDEHGEMISSADLTDQDVISVADRDTLKESFQEKGEKVDAVPGRKPPNKRIADFGLYVIEKLESNKEQNTDATRP